jgi:hypothetical protein
MSAIDPDLVRLPMWTIYDHPSDFPQSWVARLFYALPQPSATDQVLKADTLDALVAQIPGIADGRWTWLERLPADDPKIHGVFV